jgi:PAS domain S-box-containing protein
MYVQVTITVISGGGTETPAMVNYLPIIFTAGFLLGGRKGLAMAALCLITAFLIVYFEINGLLLHPTFSRTPVTRFIAFLAPFSMTLAIQYFATEHLKQAKEALQKSEADLQTIFDTTNTSYAVVNDKLKVLSFNKAARNFALKELSREPTIGDNFEDFMRVETKPEISLMIKHVLQGNNANFETCYLHSNYKPTYYDVRFSPIKIGNGSQRGFLLAVKDITELKYAENAIRYMNESLEEKVKERTMDLQQANRELEAFSYTVSHDLQAPLRVISGYGKLLLEEQADHLDTEGKEFIGVINDKVDQMRQLITDLLEFSKFGKAPLKLKEVNMNNIVRATVEEMKIGNRDLDLKVNLSDLSPAWCDEGLIRQVWANLISNAVKYSSKKEQAVVEIGCEKREGKMVYYVKDNGAGFDMKYADKLFKVFKRLHSPSEFKGTGIGLATVERILSKHEGRIWAYSQPGEGASFYFTLADTAENRLDGRLQIHMNEKATPYLRERSKHGVM